VKTTLNIKTSIDVLEVSAEFKLYFVSGCTERHQFTLHHNRWKHCGVLHESCCKTRDALCEDTNIAYILKFKWVLNERQAKRDNQVKRLCRRDIRSICDQVSRQYPEVTDLHEVSSKPLFQTRNPGVP
jgi:hypothetical protein